MLMLLWSAVSWAGAMGSPVPRVDTGRFVTGVRMGSSSHWLTIPGCEEGQSCDGVWRHTGVVALGRVAIVNGLGIDAEVGTLSDQISQANYAGTGTQWAVGLRGALPLGRSSGWWLAGNGRFGHGRADNGEQGLSLSRNEYSIGTAGVAMAWSPSYDPGVSFWGGMETAWQWSHTITPLGIGEDGISVLDVQTTVGVPLSGNIGMAVVSEPLGAPWGPSVRLAVEIEGKLGQTNMAAGQVLVLF